MPFVLMNSKERFFRQPLFLKRWETISPMPFIRTNSEERYSSASLFLRRRKEIFSDALRSDEQRGKIFFRLLRKKFKNTRPKIPF